MTTDRIHTVACYAFLAVKSQLQDAEREIAHKRQLENAVCNYGKLEDVTEDEAREVLSMTLREIAEIYEKTTPGTTP